MPAPTQMSTVTKIQTRLLEARFMTIGGEFVLAAYQTPLFHGSRATIKAETKPERY
jgi:hypothetical protein